MNNKTRGFIVLGIALVIFNLLAFTIPFAHGAVFWVSYAFTMLAITAQGLTTVMAFGKPEAKAAVVSDVEQLITLQLIHGVAQLDEFDCHLARRGVADKIEGDRLVCRHVADRGRRRGRARGVARRAARRRARP